MNKLKSALFIVALLFASQACLSVNASTLIVNNRNVVKCDNSGWVRRTPFTCGFTGCVYFKNTCNTIIIKYDYNGQKQTLNNQKNVCKSSKHKEALYEYETIQHKGKKDTYHLMFIKCQ